MSTTTSGGPAQSKVIIVGAGLLLEQIRTTFLGQTP